MRRPTFLILISREPPPMRLPHSSRFSTGGQYRPQLHIRSESRGDLSFDESPPC